MKFDLIISNPPYNHGLDLKILKEVYPLGNRFVMVHPATWLYDNKLKNKLFKNTREMVKKHFVGYEKVENANQLFGINLFTDVLITEIDKSKSGVGDKIYDIDIHGDSPIYRSLKKKILGYTKENENLDQKVHYTWKDQKTKKDENIDYIGLSIMGCNTGKIENRPGAFCSLISKKYSQNISQTSNGLPIRLYLNSKEELINLKMYLKLKITRFCLSIYKINQHLDSGELASVPYMPTYEKQWTDEEVATELGLTDEELRWAINWVPNYYPEDKEKYK